MDGTQETEKQNGVSEIASQRGDFRHKESYSKRFPVEIP